MKVLLSNNFYYPNVLGGAEISVQTLAETLAGQGVDVNLVALSGGPQTEKFTHNGVSVTALGRPRVGATPTAKVRPKLGRLAWQLSASADFGMTGALGKVMDDVQPDLMHSFNLAGMTTAIWRAAKARNLPLAHTLYGTYLVCFRGPMFRDGFDCGTQCTDCRLLTGSRKRDSALVDAVAGDSQAVLGRHLDHGYFPTAPRKMVINSGFDQTDAAPERPAYEGPLRIGFVGRFHPTKGVEVLINATEHLPQDGWTMKIGGTGTSDYEARLKSNSDPRITFLGWQHTPSFLSEIDVLVVPSIWNDPLPRVVFEAFCAGVPVVGSDLGGIPEMIQPGKTGEVFAAGDSAGLARALAPMIADPGRAASMRAACLEQAGHFSATRMAADYIRLYESLLAEKRAT